MPTDESEGPSGHPRRDGERGEGHACTPEELAFLLGGLLVELGTKIQEAGVEGVRIITEAEAQQTHLHWFREGWTQHAQSTNPTP